MTTGFRPVWSVATNLIAPQVLARTNSIYANLDLRLKPAARLFACVGRSGTTALASTAGKGGIDWKVRRLLGSTDGSDGRPGPLIAPYRTGLVAAVIGRINNGAGYVAGDSTFVVDGTSLVAASDTEPHTLCLWGTATDPSSLSNGDSVANVEFAKWSKGSSTSLTIDVPLRCEHPDNDYITTQAEMWGIEIPGGDWVRVGFDFGDDTAGENVCVVCRYTTLDYWEQFTVS